MVGIVGKGQQTEVNKAGKRLNCTVGKSYPCGSACFSLDRSCLKAMQEQYDEAAKNLMKELNYPSLSTQKTKNQQNFNKNTNNQQNSNKNITNPNQTSKTNQQKKPPRNKEVPVETILKQLALLESKQTEITNKIKQQYQTSLKKTKELISEGNNDEALNEAKSSLEELKQRKKELDDKVLKKARELLYTKNPSKMKAKGGMMVDFETREPTKKADNKKIKEWSEGINEFKKMIGVETLDNETLTVSGLDTKDPSKDRSHYRGNSNTVFMSTKADIAVVIHEVGHFLQEKDPNINKKLESFFEERTKGEKWEKLKDITGKPYGDKEIAKRDKWTNPYMGKKCRPGNSELLSMGLEMMYRNPIDFAKKDPDYFKFIYNIVRGK